MTPVRGATPRADYRNDETDQRGAAAVIDPLALVDHEALGRPFDVTGALPHPEQPHRQQKKSDHGQCRLHGGFSYADLSDLCYRTVIRLATDNKNSTGRISHA